jgi:hypothetical protein
MGTSNIDDSPLAQGVLVATHYWSNPPRGNRRATRLRYSVARIGFNPVTLDRVTPD